MDKYDSIDKIPSVADAMEIAENEGRPVCAPTSYRTCEDCGELFEASGKARYCPECKADKEKVEEWKKAQGLIVVQAAKENGAETTNTHFPGLAEERRRKRQPVTVDLTNFIPKKMEEKHMETTADVKTNPEIDVIAIAKKVSNLCDDTGLECRELCAIIESFATGFVELKKGRKDNA